MQGAQIGAGAEPPGPSLKPLDTAHDDLEVTIMSPPHRRKGVQEGSP